jgi:uncharacterized BrkB/YihY/UPF0761 family membrane protein
MAKTGKTGGIGMMAYIAICFVALAYLIVGMIAFFHAINVTWFDGMQKFGNVLMWIANILTTIVIAWCSYDFAMRQKKPWRVIWWVLVIIAILSVAGLGGFNAFK